MEVVDNKHFRAIDSFYGGGFVDCTMSVGIGVRNI